MKTALGYIDAEFSSAGEAVESLALYEVETLAQKIATSCLTVFSGVGKAGLVGQRLAALASSLGNPSQALCPTSALHGDLGGVLEANVFVFLSNSGESNEIVKLADHISKHCTGKRFAITSGKDSRLAKKCHSSVLYQKPEESGPFGLPPTTSTTVMGLIGNGVLMRAMELRGVTREEYAVSHPGGSLGGESVLVDEVMREALSVYTDASRSQVINALGENHAGIAIVYGDYVDPLGIVTLGDCARGEAYDDIFDYFTPIERCITIEKGAPVSKAMKLMRKHKVNQLPIMDEDKVVGVVDIQSLVGLGLDI